MKKCFSKIIVALLVVAMLMSTLPLSVFALSTVWDGSVADSFESGTGTEDDPYIIKTAEQLAYLASSVNAGTTYSGKFIKLANDIVLNDTSNWENWETTAPANTWTPIGTSSKSFQGTFDGDGHTVSGIYINDTTYSLGKGLFGIAEKGKIMNLGIEHSYIEGKTGVGGIAGWSDDTITNCHNTGTVIGTFGVGGLVGQNSGAIINCYNAGGIYGNDSAGGIVGENYPSANALIKDSYNTGNVSGSQCIGGIAGNNWAYDSGIISAITECYNTGNVSGSQCIGGIAGECYADYGMASIGICYNTGDISGTSKYVGGIVGQTAIKNNGSVILTDCHNVGNIRGEVNVGGVAGLNRSGAIANCYYLTGCAKDGDGTVQYGVGCGTKDKITVDVVGSTKGLNETDVKQKKSFTYWNFETVWVLNKNTGYPVFSDLKSPSIIWNGMGTSGNPYVIDNAEQLAYFASTVNVGTSYEGKFFILTSNIVLNDTSDWENWGNSAPENIWMSIGTGKKDFDGTFDGCGYIVSGIYGKQGLFSGVSGTVKNIGIEKSYIKGVKGATVGGVVGGNRGTVSNCHNSGFVIGSSQAGGVVGYNYNKGTVSGCYNTGVIVSDSIAGGVVGSNEFVSNVTGCYNIGAVSGKSEVGGVLGLNELSTISNCYNTGDVTGTLCYIGGVVGENYAIRSDNSTSTVKECYNTGNVSGKSEVGGVVGYNYSLYSGSSVTISNCYNTGNIRGTENIGGVVGYNYANVALAKVNYCYNIGVVIGSSAYVGAIIGKDYGYNGGLVSQTGCYYLNFCARDGNETIQYGIGIETKGTAKCDSSGLTEAQMKQKSSFPSFDFDMYRIWTMYGNSEYPYPELVGTHMVIGEEQNISRVWNGSIASGFESGTGTEKDPYIIKTAEQLAYLSASVNTGITYSGKYFKLKNDIVLNDTVNWEQWGMTNADGSIITPLNRWMAIGSSRYVQIPYTITSSSAFNSAKSKYEVSGLYYKTSSGYYSLASSYNNSYSQYYLYCEFNGIFDGDGHVISGIYISNAIYYQGLFGYINEGTVKNLGVAKSYIYGGSYTGGIVGKNYGTIFDCYSTANVNGSSLLGGVVGYNYGTVTDCYNTGDVSGNLGVGGVVGDSDGTVTDCYNAGTVSGDSYVGGVAGAISRGTVVGCYYLTGCAKDGNGTVQYGVGNSAKGSTTGDVSGKTIRLTKEQMKKKEMFSDFDFEAHWEISTSEGYDYPTLQNVKHISSFMILPLDKDGMTATIIGYSGNASEIIIPKTVDGYNVIAISENAFSNNKTITSVTIPSSVKTIGDNAFEGCRSLIHVNFLEGVETIGDYVFYNTGLVSATLPDSIKEIGENAFGFYDNSVIDDFIIYYANSIIAKQYADENGIVCILIQEIKDEETDITVVTEENFTLLIEQVKEGDYYDIAQQIVKGNDNVLLFKIKIIDNDLQEINPKNALKLSIPIPVGFNTQNCDVYRIDNDNTVKAMCSDVVDGKLVFVTQNLGYYTIVSMGQTISGGVRSFGSADDPVTVKLISDGIVIHTIKTTEKAYLFEEVKDGTYTISVSKDKHIVCEYTVTVDGKDVQKDVATYLRGDVNIDGEVDALDATQITRYSNGKSGVFGSTSDKELEAARLKVGDVNDDGEVDALDATQVTRYSNGKPSIFDQK